MNSQNKSLNCQIHTSMTNFVARDPLLPQSTIPRSVGNSLLGSTTAYRCSNKMLASSDIALTNCFPFSNPCSKKLQIPKYWKFIEFLIQTNGERRRSRIRFYLLKPVHVTDFLYHVFHTSQTIVIKQIRLWSSCMKVSSSNPLPYPQSLSHLVAIPA